MSKQPNLKRQVIVARIQARHQLLKLLYQWQISSDEPSKVWYQQIEPEAEYADIDQDYLTAAWEYIVSKYSELEALALPYIKRNIKDLDPVEHAILWIGIYELTTRPDIHPNVSIDQAVELAKQYGGEDGHKFINGILDKIHKNLNTIL